MDLKTAYYKIDNFCCQNVFRYGKAKYLDKDGKLKPINLFADEDTKDEVDFAKDVYDMVDALEVLYKHVMSANNTLSKTPKYNVRVFRNSGIDAIHEFDSLEAARAFAKAQKGTCVISMAIEEVNL